LIIHACYEANFKEKYFSANFPPISDFRYEAFERIYYWVWTRAVLPSADMAVAVRMGKLCVRIGTLQLLKQHSFPPTLHNPFFFNSFLLRFFMVWGIFLVLYHEFSFSFVFFCILSLFQVFCSIFYMLFSLFLLL
jgi:hypothetical protein